MGRKISNILKSEIVSSIFYIALGLCLILIPDQTVNIICKVIFGLIMIAAGVYHIGIYVAEKEKATILDLFTGVITTVLGVFLFFTPQIVIKILPYLLGAFVLVDSLWKLKGTHRLRKAELGIWKVFLAGSLIFILLGIAVMFYPFIAVNKMILFCGCILTADGVIDLIFLVMLKLGLRKAEKHRRQKTENEEETSAFTKNEDTKNTDSTTDAMNTADVNNTQNTGKTGDADVAESTEDAKSTGKTENAGNTDYVLENAASETLQSNKIQLKKPDLDLETEKTADAADADNILQNRDSQNEPAEDMDDMESPRKEIREMLNNHEEPLEEWKD